MKAEAKMAKKEKRFKKKDLDFVRNKLIEEMSELTQALIKSKVSAKEAKKKKWHKLAMSEIEDVKQTLKHFRKKS